MVLPSGLTTVRVAIFPSVTWIEIGVVGEISLDPNAGVATTAAAGFGGAIGLGVVVAGALGVLAAETPEDAAALTLGGSTTLTAPADVEIEVPVAELVAVDTTVGDPLEELFDLQATVPTSRPTAIPIRAVRRPQVLIDAVVLIACPYGSCAGSILTLGARLTLRR